MNAHQRQIYDAIAQAAGIAMCSTTWKILEACQPGDADATAVRDGLTALASAGAMRVPAVRGLGASGEHCFLALEWIELAATTPRSDERLGEQLATLHRARAGRFGFERDNFIGRTVQPNAWHDDWVQFLKAQRLGHQLQLAAEAGHGGRVQQRGRRLLEVMDLFFYEAVPTEEAPECEAKPTPDIELEGDVVATDGTYIYAAVGPELVVVEECWAAGYLLVVLCYVGLHAGGLHVPLAGEGVHLVGANKPDLGNTIVAQFDRDAVVGFEFHGFTRSPAVCRMLADHALAVQRFPFASSQPAWLRNRENMLRALDRSR